MINERQDLCFLKTCWYKNSLRHYIKTSGVYYVKPSTKGERVRNCSGLKHEMILFVQRKTRVYKYHSFIQQELISFVHQIILAFLCVPIIVLALGIQWRYSLWVSEEISVSTNSSHHSLIWNPFQDLSDRSWRMVSYLLLSSLLRQPAHRV